MKIKIDGDLCAGHGRCYTLAPELLAYDDEGYVNIRGSEMEVPPNLESSARDAANACPESAITLED
jgi:ferredoxin